ncbi:MAG: asparagine synthase (glutamine-hydrolyzing) [Nitrospinota bacterium]
MCGICGFISSTDVPDSQAILHSMCDAIVHRGPNAEGVYVDGRAHLGMRRLKIIDLETGNQPIFNEDKTVVLLFNGEIYNFRELKDTLLKQGHQFYTSSDTEVIAHLYEEYGEGFLSHLNGMFGISLWDKKEDKLILARDRMGEKPLYYSQTKSGFLYGSELKSLLCYPDMTKELNKNSIYHYFSFNYVPGPETIYENVFKLLPGEYLTLKNNIIGKKRFWTPKFQIDPKTKLEEVEERLFDELGKAVKQRLISDVPLGAFLSGGIDSGIMVALMSRFSSSPVKTFSIGLENQNKSELPYSRAVAERYGTEHHELIARPDKLKLMEKLIWHFDEPFGDSSAIPTFLVSELTKEHVTVAISGDGGDELFGGYERYQRIMDRSQSHRFPYFFRKGLSLFPGELLPVGFSGKAYLQSLKYNDYDFFGVGTSEEFKKSILSKDFLAEMEGLTSHVIPERHIGSDESLLNQCMYFDMNVYLPDDILTKVDRMSMANSLESRAPFLDHHLVEFALQIPPGFKIHDRNKKYILKKTFKKELPEAIFTHKKTGFSIPLEEWFRQELKPFIFEVFSKSRVESVGILDFKMVEKILKQHISGTHNHKRVIWMMVAFQLWYENWCSQTHPALLSLLKKRELC